MKLNRMIISVFCGENGHSPIGVGFGGRPDGATRCFGGQYSKIPCEITIFLLKAGNANLQVAMGGEISVFMEYKNLTKW